LHFKWLQVCYLHYLYIRKKHREKGVRSPKILLPSDARGILAFIFMPGAEMPPEPFKKSPFSSKVATEFKSVTKKRFSPWDATRTSRFALLTIEMMEYRNTESFLHGIGKNF
jgi:hypothetical protein